MIFFFKLELEMLTWKTRCLQVFDLKSKPDFFKKKKEYNFTTTFLLS